jgi:hypothetical protein
MATTTWPKRRRFSSSRTSTMGSFPMPTRSQSSTRRGDQRRCSRSIGTATPTPRGRPLMAASGVVGPTSGPVINSTTAFFNAFLKHEHGALQAVAAEGRSSLSTVHTAWKPGSSATLPIPTLSLGHLHATVTPDTGLHDGQAVTVRWSGYASGKQGGQHPRVLPCGHRHRQLSRLQLRPGSDPAPRPHRIGLGDPSRWHWRHRQRCLRRSAQLLRHREQCELDRPSRH